MFLAYKKSFLGLHSVSAGTAHGFGVYDYRQKKEALNKCTLNPAGNGKTEQLAWSLLHTKYLKLI